MPFNLQLSIREKVNAEFFCRILTANVHTVLEQQLYRFHPLLTEVVRDFC